MANKTYAKAKEGILSGNINWISDNIKAVLINSGSYTADIANHQFLSDIPAPARVAMSGNLASKTATNGVADAADLTFTALSGAIVHAVVLYKDTGTASTSRLIAYIDTSTSGLPFTPNGGDLNWAWDNGAAKIFRLVDA